MARSASAAEIAGDTRERILAAALAAFSENGFDGATTRDIAARAGVNLGLIQYYFEGKRNLWRAAVDRAFAELREGMEEVLRDPALVDERERTRRLLRAFVRFVARHPEFVRLMHDEGKRGGPRMRWLVDRHVRSIYEAAELVLARAQEAGLLPRDLGPVHFYYIVAGSVALIFHQAEECRRLAGVDPRDEDVVEGHADAVERLLLGATP